MEKKKRKMFRKRMAAVVLTLCMVVGMLPFTGTMKVQAAGSPSWDSSAYNDANPLAKGGYYGQCTWYAWGRAYEVMGKSLPCTGNAKTWYGVARDKGWSVGSEPRANSIAVWDKNYGHVAYVESVNGSSVTISEANFRTNSLDEQSWSLSVGIQYYDGIRTLTTSQMQSRYGTLLGYIYLGEAPTPSESPGSRMETGGERVISDGDYHIVSALEGTHLNPGQKCLAIGGLPNSKNTNGANAELGSVLGLKDYVFTVTWLDNGFYKIKLKESGKCLDVESGDTLLGKNVQQWEDNGSDAQQWCIKETADGLGYTLQARCSRYYLDVNISDPGRNIHVWEGYDTNAQRWYFVPWGGGSSASQELQDGEYHIVPRTAPDKALNATGNGVTDGTNVQLWACREDGRHTFQVRWLGNGYYELINTNSGLALDVHYGLSKVGANVQLYTRRDENNKKWLIKSSGDGYYNIISKSNGLYVDVANAKTDNGTNIHLCTGWGINGADCQQFQFVPWGPSVGKTIENGEYQIVSMLDESKTLSVEKDGEEAGNGTNLELNSHKGDKKHTFDIHYLGNGYYNIVNIQTDLALDAANGGMTNGSNAQLWELNSTSDMQKWIIKPCGDGSFFIISRKNNLYLDVAGSTADGTNVHMWQGHGGNNQKWRIVPYVRPIEVENLVLNKNTLTLPAGTQALLKATVNPENATDKTLTWESDNKSVADVDGNGIVTAKSAGTATITVTSANGKTAACQITVEEKEEHTHAYTGTWKSDEDSHWKECECENKAEMALHDFAWVTDKAATEESTGIKHEECRTCGYKRKIGTVIEKLPPDNPIPGTRYWGDVDGKDGVTVYDALLILLHLADKQPITDKVSMIFADCDGKDGITVADALYILEVLADKREKKLYDGPELTSK